jgi:serine/threonine-protein kinase
MAQAVDAASLCPGALLFRRYVVEERLGEGGVGVVVAARDQVLRRRVAIKCLRQTVPHSRSLAIRFLREGRAMAQLESPHAVRIFDARPGVLVMEYLRGVDLARLLTQRGCLSAREAAVLILQACDALAEAHARRIIHRDLKLENLFFTRRPGNEASGYIKVLDFGLSKVLSEHHASRDEVTLTDTQCVLGSVEFMSPEQVRSARDVDVRTDVWALGVVLFALLTGQRPFARRFMAEVRGAVLAGDFPALSGLRDDLPPGLESVVQRCLRVDREQRYESVNALAAALLPFAGERRRSLYGSLGKEPAEAAERETSPPSLLSRIGLAQLFSSREPRKPTL